MFWNSAITKNQSIPYVCSATFSGLIFQDSPNLFFFVNWNYWNVSIFITKGWFYKRGPRGIHGAAL